MRLLARIGIYEAFLLFLVALFAADLGLNYWAWDRAVERASEEVLTQAAEAATQAVRALEGDAEAVLARAAEPSSVDALDFGDVRAANAFLLWYLETHPSISSVNYGDSLGNGYLLLREGGRWRNRIKSATDVGTVVWLEVDRSGRVLTQDSRSDDYDPRRRPWYENALAGSGPRWSEPYVFRTTREPGVTVSERLPDDGSGVVRVVGVDLLLRDVVGLLESLSRNEPDLDVHLVSASGTIVASSDSRRFGPYVSTEAPRLPTLEDDGFAVPAGALASSADGESFASFDVSGSDYYGLVAPPVGGGDLDLRIVLTVPRDTLLADFEQSNRLRASVFLLIAVVGASLFVRLYVRPLRQLRGVAHDLRRGADVELPTTRRRDDVGVLVTEFAGMAADLRERQSQLRQAVDEWHLTFDSMTDHVAVHDRDFVIRLANRTMAADFGLEPRDIIGSHCHDLYHSPDERCPGCPTAAVAKTGDPGSGEIESSTLGRTFAATAAPIRDADGTIVGFVHVMRDVTEQKKFERRIAESQKMEALGRLAGGIAHDFNNMLGVILGYTDEAISLLESGHPVVDNLLEVRAAAERSAALTRDLLAFSRRQPVAPTVLDVNTRLRGMEAMLARILGEDVRLELDLGPDLWLVRIDPSQFDQVVTNLAVNSRDAMPNGGLLVFRTTNLSDGMRGRPEAGAPDEECIPGDVVVIEARDDGHGMDEETAARAFEPFFTTRGPIGGTGLGLATVHGIASQNGGAVAIDSSPGRGTAVSVRLPRHLGEDEAAQADVPAPSPEARGETVLLVEDEPQIRRLIGTVLRRSGYSVLDTDSPEEALGLASEHPEIDLVITDVVMPRMNGKELESRVRAIRPSVKTLFISGYTDDIVAARGIPEDGVHFLAKPFAPSELTLRVREILDAG